MDVQSLSYTLVAAKDGLETSCAIVGLLGSFRAEVLVEDHSETPAWEIGSRSAVPECNCSDAYIPPSDL